MTYAIFGEADAGHQARIDAAGGAKTTLGRELMFTYVLQNYVKQECVLGTDLNDIVSRLIRAMGRGVVSTAATVCANTEGVAVGDAAGRIMSGMMDAVEDALRELARATQTTTVIHRNHRSH